MLRRREHGESSHTHSSSPERSEPILHTMKWGLVPHWSKHEDMSMNTTNARSENLTESGGMWASIKGKRRCVVVCQGLVTHPPRVSSQGALTHTHTHIYIIYISLITVISNGLRREKNDSLISQNTKADISCSLLVSMIVPCWMVCTLCASMLNPTGFDFI